MAGEREPGGKRERKIPMRRCVGCGQSFPKKELVRLVRSPMPDGADATADADAAGAVVTLDFTSKKAGRGVYVCRNLTCFRKAKKAKRFEQHLSCSIPQEVYALLEAELARNERGETG